MHVRFKKIPIHPLHSPTPLAVVCLGSRSEKLVSVATKLSDFKSLIHEFSKSNPEENI